MIQGGTLKEHLKFTVLQVSSAYQAVETRYNGSTGTGTGLYLDTQGRDELLIELNVGSVSGSGSMAVDVVANTTDYISGASSIATFPTITAGNKATKRLGHIKCGNKNRFMWLRTQQTQASDVNMSAMGIQGKSFTLPESQTYDFSNTGLTTT